MPMSLDTRSLRRAESILTRICSAAVWCASRVAKQVVKSALVSALSLEFQEGGRLLSIATLQIECVCVGLRRAFEARAIGLRHKERPSRMEAGFSIGPYSEHHTVGQIRCER